MPHDMIHSYDMNPSSTHLPSLTPSVLYHGIFRSYLSCMLVEDESDYSPRLHSV